MVRVRQSKPSGLQKIGERMFTRETSDMCARRDGSRQTLTDRSHTEPGGVPGLRRKGGPSGCGRRLPERDRWDVRPVQVAGLYAPSWAPRSPVHPATRGLQGAGEYRLGAAEGELIALTRAEGGDVAVLASRQESGVGLEGSRELRCVGQVHKKSMGDGLNLCKTKVRSADSKFGEPS